MSTTARVLVVDNEVSDVRLLSGLIASQGYTVNTASTAAEAMQKMREAEYDVLFTDIDLPDDGMRLIDDVTRRFRDTMVLVAAASDNVDAAVRSLRKGAYDIVNKPVDLSRLLHVIRRALEHRRMRAADELVKAGNEIFGCKDSADQPRVIVEQAIQVLQADAGALLVPSTQSSDGGFEILHSGSVSGRRKSNKELDLGLAMAVVVSAESLRLPQDRESDKLKKVRVSARANSLAMPISKGGEILGVIVVHRRAGDFQFSAADMHDATTLATIASQAMDNMALLVKLQARLTSLERARKKLSSSVQMEVMGRRAARLSHVIQNPVQYIQSHVRILTEFMDTLDEGMFDIDTASPRNSLADINDGARRVSFAANELGALARGRYDVNFELRRAVESAVRLVQEQLKTEIVTEVADCLIKGNLGHLTHALSALIINADEATRAAGKKEPVWVRSFSNRMGGVIIVIEDKGVGIDRRKIKKVMEPFYTTKDDAMGTGLGLSTSREIIERHGGTIELESRKGRGTTVTIMLPVTEEAEDELLMVGE